MKGHSIDQASEPCAIGVDLGGTKIRAALVNRSGEVLQTVNTLTDSDKRPEKVIGQIVELAGVLKPPPNCRPAGLGIGVAGQVRPDSGTVRFAPNLNWRNVDIIDELERRLELPTVILNDVQAATFGEWRHGAGKGVDDLVCIFVGTGIGGGMVSGGRMVTGHAGTAGEFGHMTVVMNGPECSCGRRGCMEALAGGWAIARKARQTVIDQRHGGETMIRLAGGRIEDISAETVAKAFEQSDPLAVEIIDLVAETLTAGIASIINVVGPKIVVLGGGVLNGLPHIIPQVADGVRSRALSAAVESVDIVPAELGKTAGVVGMAAWIFSS